MTNNLRLNNSSINTTFLSKSEMEQIEGGKCSGSSKGTAYACGAGLGLIFLTGGIGALIFGPSTAALCAITFACDWIINYFKN